jgi:hypothetical protein
MANTGDILAPKLLADGTFEEVVLTPAAIGAAPADPDQPLSAFTAKSIWDGANGRPALEITDDRVFLGGVESDFGELKQNFRQAIGAASAADLATLESSLGTLATQDSEAVEITGGSAHFDTLSAGNDHAAVNGNLTIAANGDIIGTGANKLIGFTFIGTAGGATY